MPIAVLGKPLERPEGRTGLSGSKNVKQNKALQTLKRQSVGHFTFARINSCTIRIDGANKRAVGWLMEVAWPGGTRQRWVARLGNRASEPLPLDAAKRAAVTMLRERVKAEPRDWIAELNKIAAAEVDRAALAQERKRWPVDILGGQRRGMIDAETRAAVQAEIGFVADEAPQTGEKKRAA